MSSSSSGGSGIGSQRPTVTSSAPVRRSRSCHYDLRKRVLINNFLKDQRTSTPIRQDYCARTDDGVLQECKMSVIAASTSSTDASEPADMENHPPRTAMRCHPSSSDAERVNALRRPPELQRRLHQASLLEANLRCPVTPKHIRRCSTFTPRDDLRYDPHRVDSGKSTSRVLRHRDPSIRQCPYPTPSYQEHHGTRHSNACVITYEYPPYKIVIPAMHEANRVIVNCTSTKNKVRAKESVRSPRGQIRRRSSVRKALGRLLSTDNKIKKAKNRQVKPMKEKLRKSILGAIFNWKKNDETPRASASSTSASELEDATLVMRMRRQRRRADVGVVRSHTIHVPRRDPHLTLRQVGMREDAGKMLKRRKSMGSYYDCRTLRAMAKGDEGFN